MNENNFISIFYPFNLLPQHNEDSWLVSKQLAIYAVADGVTDKSSSEKEQPTGPKIVADLFCAKAVEYLENNFDRLSDSVMEEAYEYADIAIRNFNDTQNKDFAAVASLAAVKNNKIFGSRLTDCGLALLRGKNLIFKTPEFWSRKESQNQEGYGVLNGRMNVGQYLNLYNLDYQAGDKLVLFSDGFENHFEDAAFLGLFSLNDLEQLKKKLDIVDQNLIAKNHLRYGLERTLLIVKL